MIAAGGAWRGSPPSGWDAVRGVGGRLPRDGVAGAEDDANDDASITAGEGGILSEGSNEPMDPGDGADVAAWDEEDDDREPDRCRRPPQAAAAELSRDDSAEGVEEPTCTRRPSVFWGSWQLHSALQPTAPPQLPRQLLLQLPRARASSRIISGSIAKRAAARPRLLLSALLAPLSAIRLVSEPRQIVTYFIEFGIIAW